MISTDGRTLHAYDTGANDAVGRLAVFWHHGSPNIGAPPEPRVVFTRRVEIFRSSLSGSWIVPLHQAGFRLSPDLTHSSQH